MTYCPLCWNDITEAVAEVERLKLLPLGWLQAAILRELVDCWPRAKPSDDLAYAIYQGDEPKDVGVVFSVTLMKLRKALNPLGWTIQNVTGSGGSGNRANYALRKIGIPADNGR